VTNCVGDFAVLADDAIRARRQSTSNNQKNSGAFGSIRRASPRPRPSRGSAIHILLRLE
jgi:hypothetical protein